MDRIDVLHAKCPRPTASTMRTAGAAAAGRLAALLLALLALVVVDERGTGTGKAVVLTLRDLVIDTKHTAHGLIFWGDGTPWALSVSRVEFRNGALYVAGRPNMRHASPDPSSPQLCPGTEGASHARSLGSGAHAPTQRHPPHHCRCLFAMSLGSFAIEDSAFLNCGKLKPDTETAGAAALFYGFNNPNSPAPSACRC